MAFQLHQGFKTTITLNLLNAEGGQGIVEGTPVWSASIPEVVILTPSADGMSCDVTWAGAANSVIISSLSDGDLGAGVFPVATADEFELVAPLGAVSASTVIGAEVPA
jgi:hypothetical protein